MPEDQKKSFPTVARQAEIDRTASGLAQVWFAQGWISQPQNPNYHEDYVIECVPDGELSGEKISVQQKAHEEVSFQDGLASEVMKTKHLRYYAEKVRVPMFLLVVDVAASHGYYLFLQEWLERETTPEVLRLQESLTVKVPEGNRLDNDAERFRAEVRRALAYMAKKHPGEVADAVAHDEKQVMAVDPRWDVKLNYVHAQKQYFLRAKETIKASLQVTGSAAEKMREAYEYGKPVQLDGASVSLKGSPLFEKWESEGGIAQFSVSPVKRLEGEIHLWSEGGDGFRLVLRGLVTCGKVGMAISGALADVPLSAEFKIFLADIKRAHGNATFNLWLDFSIWEGRPVTALPYFGEFRRFAQAISQNRTIHCQPVVNGEQAKAGQIENPQGRPLLTSGALVIEIMEKARALSEKCGVEIRFPRLDQVNTEEFDWLAMAYGVLIEGEFRASGHGVRLNMTMNRRDGDLAAILKDFEKVAVGGYAINRPSQKFTIFGTSIDLGAVVYEVAPTIGIFPEPGRSDFLAGRTPTVAAQFEGTAGSIFRVFPKPTVQ